MTTTGNPRTFLAIEAHADDATLGAGGILLEAARRGHRVVIVTVVSDFATWATSAGREAELREGLVEIAGEYRFERIFMDYPYHRISSEDLELKRRLSAICAEVNPDVGFIHHHEDHWPDHAACGKAGKDALMFPHGLTDDLHARPCPLIYSFDISGRQTYHFEPDAFYDVGHVMGEYMELIWSTCSVYFGWRGDDGLAGRFQYADGGEPRELKLCVHGLRRFADCIRFGNIARCTYALGFKTVCGKRRGEDLMS